MPDEASRPPEAKTEIPLSWQAVAISLVRSLDLHEGYWRVDVQFGRPIRMQANLTYPRSQKDPTLVARQFPAGMLPLTGLVLTRVAELSDTAVDAATVNPPPSRILEVTH